MEISEWSAAFHFQGSGQTSQVPPAPVFNSVLESTINWQPIDGAASYDVVIYNTLTGQEFDSATGLTDSPFAFIEPEKSFFPDGSFRYGTSIQAFYRVRNSDGSIGFWSNPLELIRAVDLS